MNNQKISKSIIIVLIVVLFVGIFCVYKYWWTPRQEMSKQPEVPDDWKTYRNEEYRFEIKYPPSLTSVCEEDKELCQEVIAESFGVLLDYVRFNSEDKEMPVGYKILVHSREKAGVTDWNEWIREFSGSYVQLGDRQGVMAVLEKKSGAIALVDNQRETYSIVFEFGGGLWKSGAYSEAAENNMYNTHLEYFHQILSTLRFLE